jgi:tRNA (guanosine-2'-O-)-methyltransferase
MENVHDPHNVSAVLRTCDAVGVLRVELVYTTEKFPRIGRKSSSSAGKWIERRKHPSIDECYRTLRASGKRIYAAVLNEQSGSLFDIDCTGPVAFVFGNEHRGVSDDAAKGADGTFKIPMLGMIESLNISVACGVTLFEALRQRLRLDRFPPVPLDQQELAERVKQWSER